MVASYHWVGDVVQMRGEEGLVGGVHGGGVQLEHEEEVGQMDQMNPVDQWVGQEEEDQRKNQVKQGVEGHDVDGGGREWGQQLVVQCVCCEVG